MSLDSATRFDSRTAQLYAPLLLADPIVPIGKATQNVNTPRKMNKSSGWSVVLSVLMILAGLLAIIIPPMAGVAATLIIGWLLVLCGGAHLVYCWHRRGIGAVTWEVLVGLLYFVIGIYLIVNPVAGLASLTIGLAIYLFIGKRPAEVPLMGS